MLRSAPLGAHYHVDVPINTLLGYRLRELLKAGLWYAMLFGLGLQLVGAFTSSLRHFAAARR